MGKREKRREERGREGREVRQKVGRKSGRKVGRRKGVVRKEEREVGKNEGRQEGGRRKEEGREGGRRCVNKEEIQGEGDSNTDLAVLVWVFLHPHPGQVGLRQTDGQLETFWTQDLSGQHAHHRFTVSSLRDQRNAAASAPSTSDQTCCRLTIN